MNRIIPLVLAVALFMEQMDTTVIATSLPAIAADLNTEPVALKLALTSYLVALAIFIPISGWVADRFGARNVFRWAILVFMLGSVACAFADSLAWFVVARFAQGMGGAMMTPVGRLVLVRLTPRHQLIRAMSLLTIPALIGPIAGPPLGGFITTYFSWHWIFLINVPIGLLGIVMATKYLARTGYRDHRHIDTVGFLLTGLCFSGTVFGLSVISLPALPPMYGVAGVIIGVISGLLYLRHYRRVEDPLLNLRLFRLPIFAAAFYGGSVFRIGVGAMAFLLPLMFQISFGMTPFEAGMIVFVTAIGAITVKFVIQAMLGWLGFRTVLVVSALLAGATVAINGFFVPGTPIWLMMLAMLIGGFVRSTFFTADGIVVYSEIADEDVAPATAMVAVGQQITIAIGVALAGLLLETSSAFTGGELELFNFHLTFWVMGAIASAAAFWFIGLPRDAARNLSGHIPVERAAKGLPPAK
jgi:EmrB/QacA subfamily drug resistance transporter